MKKTVLFQFFSMFLICTLFDFSFQGNVVKFSDAPPNPLLQYLSPDPQNPPYSIFLPLLKTENLNVLPGKYVSPAGNDLNPGTFQLPWKTIKKAASSVKPGDVIYIRGGTFHEYVSINQSGTETQPIQFLAYPGEKPIIDGEMTLPKSQDGLFTLDGDWIVVSGLEVINSTYIGIASYGRHNTIRDVFVHHNWRDGVHLSGDFGTLQDSRIWRNSIHSEYGVEAGSSGVAISRDEIDGITDDAIIRRNVVWENWGLGINTHHSNNVTIEDNTSYDNYQANIYIHDTQNILCQRNLIYQTPDNAYMGNSGPEVGILMGEEYSPPLAKNIRVINNIAYGNHRNLFWYTGDMGGGMNNVLFANNTFVNGSGSSSNGNCNVILDPGVNVNVIFENNIVYQKDNTLPVIGTVTQAGVTYTRNLWSKTPVLPARGAGDIIGDPLFAQTGQPYAFDWFVLKTNSPAINKALPLSEVTDDFRKTLRGSIPDIGALEYIP